uniref:RING-type E3 ubiquitin transferase n=1 Tax=Solanum tuberosum TaxID=4113 RepID=M1AVZ8_SOLTU
MKLLTLYHIPSLFLFTSKNRFKNTELNRSEVENIEPNGSSLGNVDVKGMLKTYKLPVILFDEDSMMKDSQCCVCLGEFEIKEELHQLPSCKHIFHVECIRHWLRSNFSCPLCRCHVLVTNKKPQPPQQPPSNNNPSSVIEEEREHHDITVSREEHEQHVVVIVEELSSASSSSSSIVDNIERDFSNVETHVINIDKAPDT